jgi:hypothetical protein
MRPPLSTLVLSLGMLVLALFGCGILKSAVSNKSAEVATLEHEIEVQNTNASRIASARAALAALAGDEDAVRGYFVPQTGVVAFIDDLQSRGQALGTQITIDSVSADAEKAVITLSATIEGPFDAVMRTVGSIEYAPYDVSVTELSVMFGGKDVWTAHLMLSVGSVPGTPASTTPSS